MIYNRYLVYQNEKKKLKKQERQKYKRILVTKV